ncbi:hypothetical protein EZS27_005543 [termite gut metagenome]|uniref:SPOR domain-containing protein n=1 Tax=termite gut metagenome TaxID=433724 RepID=A0A5J4SMN4_9ZZZZ
MKHIYLSIISYLKGTSDSLLSYRRKRKILCGILLLFSLLYAQAQTSIITALQNRTEGEGKITIHQTPHIEALLGTRHTGDGVKILKTFGYRVQLYAGNNSREAHNYVINLASRVKELFPDTEVYTFFTPPRWICQVGDFLTIEEADAMLHQLKSFLLLKDMFIVKEQINIRL